MTWHARRWRTRREPRSGEVVSIGEIVEGLLQDETFARGMPIARLADGWSQVVGERIAGETAPVSLEGGVLVVSATNGPWGAQARFLGDQIRLNANEMLGSEAVSAVRVVVRNSR